MPVLAVSPGLMDLHDGVENGQEVCFGSLGKGLGKGGHGRFAVLLALAPANVDLKTLQLFLAHQRGNSKVVGEQLDAIVGNQ